jgi:ALG11 mannosyltransferase N-terminus
MGVPFAYPVVRLAGIRTVSYTHYPYVSLDMLQRVADRTSMYNNPDDVAGSPAVSLVKLLYYHSLAVLYGMAGFFADVRLLHLLAHAAVIQAATLLWLLLWILLYILLWLQCRGSPFVPRDGWISSLGHSTLFGSFGL